MRRWLLRLFVATIMVCLAGTGYTESNQQKKDDIEIMCAVFDRAVEQQYGCVFQPRGSCRGVYLEGYGAVFILQAGSPFGEIVVGRIGPGAAATGLDKKKLTFSSSLYSLKERQSAGPDEDEVARLKGRFSELFARYGPTIRGLKEEDWLTAVIFRDAFSKAEKSTLIIQVKGKVLAEYKAGRMDMERFRKEVKITEY